MIDDFVLHMLANQGRCHNALFRAADELLAMHPLAWWERPYLRFVRWWHGRKLAEILELLPGDKRAEVLGVGPE